MIWIRAATACPLTVTAQSIAGVCGAAAMSKAAGYCQSCLHYAFDYETPKTLVIPSLRVGCVFRFTQLLVVLYVVGWVTKSFDGGAWCVEHCAGFIKCGYKAKHIMTYCGNELPDDLIALVPSHAAVNLQVCVCGTEGLPGDWLCHQHRHHQSKRFCLHQHISHGPPLLGRGWLRYPTSGI